MVINTAGCTGLDSCFLFPAVKAGNRSSMRANAVCASAGIWLCLSSRMRRMSC